MRRALAVLVFAAFLVGVVGLAPRAEASAYKPCVYVWYVVSDTPLRLCVPLIVTSD